MAKVTRNANTGGSNVLTPTASTHKIKTSSRLACSHRCPLVQRQDS
jgi:hypothetical protein